MKKILTMLVFSLFVCVSGIFAQPRQIETKKEVKPVTPAPEKFAAKYEGGMFGFSEKQEGTLKFDDENERIIFFGKDLKEKFAIPYEAMLLIYPQSQSVRSTAGSVISAIPLPGAGLAGFLREKRRYLIVHFQDVDVEARGVVNFKIEDKVLLDSVIVALAKKAELKERGEAYYRPRKVTARDNIQ